MHNGILMWNSWMQQSDCTWTCLVNQGVVNCWQGALILVHCLVLQVDVPGLQCTSLAVVGIGVDHFCSCPINVMHLVDCVLCHADWAVFPDTSAFRDILHYAEVALEIARKLPNKDLRKASSGRIASIACSLEVASCLLQPGL